jgi:hypothetical protein
MLVKHKPLIAGATLGLFDIVGANEVVNGTYEMSSIATYPYVP